MKVELLAPAGSWEAMTAAVAAGADAVYLGGSMFGARAYAKNLDQQQIKDAIDYLHLHHRKLYLTVNTLLKEEELEEKLFPYLLPLYEHGLDAVIVQDFGVFSAIRTWFPDLAIHASTQMCITGPASARMLEQKGAVRIVPAREMNLQEIRKMHDTTNLEIECFVHGALCYCYSGMCLFSSILGGRSGNRGRCAQPCRLPYEVWRESGRMGEKGDDYPISPKDMCTLDLIPQMIEAGITSFKIEGRMKKPEYTAGVVSVYRKYLDLYEKKPQKFRVLPEDRKILMDIYNRDGFNQSYYLERNGRDMMALRNEKLKMGKERNDQLFYELERDYLNKTVQEPISGFLTLYPGMEASLTVNFGSWTATSVGQIVEYADKHPVQEEKVRQQMMKTGNSPFCFEELDIYMDDSVFFPVKGLNDLRREALDSLAAQILSDTRRHYRRGTEEIPERLHAPKTGRTVALTALCEERWQMKKLLAVPELSAIYASVHCFSRDAFVDQVRSALYVCRESGKQLYLVLPHVVRMGDLDVYREVFPLALEEGLAGFLVRNLESYAWLKEQGLGHFCVTDYSLYHFNSRAQDFWKKEGILFATAPLELNSSELRQRDNSTSELIVYGYIPMMVSAQCVRKTMAGCNHKREILSLRDRYNKDFHVKCYCKSCYNVIYNSVPLSLLKEAGEIGKFGFRSVRMSFSIESEEETERISDQFIKVFCRGAGADLEGEFTKGHYRRGVE